MGETPERYQARLASYMEGQDPLIVQEETPSKLARMIENIPAQVLAGRPIAGKWSIVEILAHLAEDEITSTWRYRQMIEHDGVLLHGFDQDLWQQLGDYRSWNATDALEMFRLLREANLRMLRALTAEQWQRSGQHTERGRLTVAELARHMAAHDLNHIKQIERLLAVNTI